MQCFGGCFAADREQPAGRALAGKDATSTSSDSWAVTTAGKNGPYSSTGMSSQASAQACDGVAVRDQNTSSSKEKLRMILGKGSKKQLPKVSSAKGNSVSSVDREELRREFTMQHGRHILAVSTLQQDELQFFVMPGIGYIAYAMMFNGPAFLDKRTAAGLSDPVCDQQHFKTIATAFLKEHPKAMWAQVSFQFAEVLQTLGFTCNSMGGETRMDLATYNFTGYARRGLRSAIASAVKEGLSVEEVMQPAPETFGNGVGVPRTAASSDWAALAAEMQELDSKWAASKNGRANDVWFINRRPIFTPEPGVRKFVARNAAGELQAFIFFDGVFEGGKLVGYYANVTRIDPNAHPGALNLMIKTFIEKVRSESQLAAPAKKLSMRKSQRKKLEAAAKAAAEAADTAATRDSSGAAPSVSVGVAAEAVAASTASATSTAAPAGPSFLSLGLSPFFQMDNSIFKHCKTTHLLLLLCYHDGAGFYPFKTLAAAKAKYGAGLHNFKYEDPAVEYRQAYLCHRRGGTAFIAMFDLARLYGFWTDPADCLARYSAYKLRQGADLVKRGVKKAAGKGKKKKLQSSSSNLSTASSLVSSSSLQTSPSLATSPSLQSVPSLKSSASLGGSEVKKQKAPNGPAKQTSLPKGSASAAVAAAGGAAAATAAAVGAAAAAATGGELDARSRVGSAASLIATVANPPHAASTTTDASTSDGSDAASFASAVGSSSEFNAQVSRSTTRLSNSSSDA